MTGNSQVILEIDRAPAPSQQTPQSITSNQSTIPNGSQVIELDSEDDDDDDDTLRYYSDENSDELSDDDDDEFESRRREILRRLQPNALHRTVPPGAVRAPAPAAVRRPVIPYNPGEVVDLLSDDDEPPARPTAPAPARPALATTRPPTAPARSATQPAASTNAAGVAAARAAPAAATATPGLNTLARAATATGTPSSQTSASKRSLETTPTVTEPAKRRKITVNGVEIKLEFEPKQFGEANITDEVVEVLGEDEVELPSTTASAAKSEVEMVVAPGGPAKSAAVDEDSDFEDFQIVGGTMQVASDMPHQRYACTMHPFRMAPAQHNSAGQKQSESAGTYAERCRMNLKHCAKCYCYVCDMVVTECAEWAQHCHATHKEPRWKQEKDSRNSKILSLMTPQNRAAFFQRYKDALSTAVRSGMATTSNYDSDDDDFVGEYMRMANSMSSFGEFGGYAGFGAPPVASGNPRDLTNTANLLNLVQAKLMKSKQLTSGNSSNSTASTPNLKPSSSSGALSESGASVGSPRANVTDKEVFLEASELLMRAITSPRHAGDAPMLIARAFVTWFMNPLCSLDLRTILRNEMTNAQARSMVLTSGLYQGLKELVQLDNASVLKLRQRSVESASPAAGAVTAALPMQLMGISEQVQALLIPELLDLGNFAAIKHLVALRPNLVPSLLLYHIRNGSSESCREGVALVYQYCAQRNFSTLRNSIQDIELPKLFKFLAAVLAHNMAATASTAPASQAQLRQLHDSVTDVLFNILMTKIYDTIKVEHAAVIATSIDAYMAREGSVSNPIRLDNVLSWIETETAQTYNFSPLVVVLYLKYSNWRVNFATYAATASFTVIPPLIITPSVYGNLRFPLLVVLANAFCKYFAVSPQSLDTADINAGVNMACHIAARSFHMLNGANKLTDFDSTIREAWMTLPDLRKAASGEMCSAHASLKTPSFCVVCAADKHTELKFCPTLAFTSKNSLNRPTVASWRAVMDSDAPMKVTATYCDVHHTYDTFLMSLVVPKNPVETRVAFACWGHQLQLHELTYLLSQLDAPTPGKEDASMSAYISFLTTNREYLYILWKGVLRQMYAYMHAMYHVETTSMASLLANLARVVKPWLSELDVVTVNQFSAHASCRGFNQSQLADLQALDLNLRVTYQFSKFLSKLQQTANGGALTLNDVRHFKASIPRFDAVTNPQNLSARMCHLYLLEYPTVSTRAIWHSFWRRFLLCLVSKRTFHGHSEVQVVEDLAISLQLEDWAQVRELIAKAPATPRLVRNFLTALALLQASDVTAMMYGGVSGSQVLRTELEKVLRIKYTVPVLQETPLTHISDMCLDHPDSALAHLVLQLPPDLLQYGALDYQPFFTYALQKKVDASATSILATSDTITALNSCYKLVMRAHEDCVAIFATPGRNMSISYAKVLCGLACLRRYDLVRVLVAAGYETLVARQSTLGQTRLKLVVDTLMLAHSRADFELLLEVMDGFIAEAYLESSAFATMAPVIRKFCPLADLQITTSSQSSTSSVGTTDSSRIKLLRFYHAYDAQSFLDYWRTAARTEEEKAHILKWMQSIQNSTRFRTAVHLSVMSQLLDPTSFGAYLNGPELEKPSIDKLVVFNTLLQLIPTSPGMVSLLVTATVRILLNMAYLNDSMRASLTACCTEATLPIAPTGEVPGYADARTLLLFVANPVGSAHVDALANVYTVRTPKEKENMCKVLFSKDKPSALIRLLLRVRDYKQLFRTLKDAYYTSVISTELPSAQAVALALEHLRGGLSMTNLYNESATGNSSITAFQKQLFDEGSFTVGLAKFLLVLTEHHIDDRTPTFPEPLNVAVNTLLEAVRNFVHSDAVVMSYLQLHVKFTTATALQFFNDCGACNYATIPFTPLAHAKTKPSTLCLDTLTTIVRAPKFYTLALSYITVINFLVATLTQNVLRAGPSTQALLASLVNCPCRYRRDSKEKNSLASKGLLWIPKADSGGAAATTSNELTRLLQSFGPSFAEIVEEPILLRLWAGEVTHKFDNVPAPTVPEGGPSKITLKEWYQSHSDSLLRIVEQMRPAASYSYLLDLMGLYINFNHATFSNNLFQALSRPYAHLYRKIVLNLLVYSIVHKAMDLKIVLKVLCHEFHHPDNHFGLYFSEPELNLVMDYLQSTDDLRDRTRQAIMARDGTAQVPLNSLLKIPRVLQLIAKDFTKEMAYDSFGALHHAAFFLTMWKELAATSQAGVAFEQANDCFRAIALDFKSRTVQARLRTIFEGLLPHYKQFLDLYPDRAAEVKALKMELRQIVKSKPALVKALAVLN